MLKKILISVATLGLSALLVSSAAPFGGSATTTPRDAPSIALVNEDQAAAFNGTEYLFGKDFVDLVSHDSRYNWQVVSRSVAEKAYADKAVGAVIVLPRSFSRDILTLQDIDPAQAQIDYKVLPGDALSEQRLQNEVSSILRDFNSRVVQVYFASVAANIAGAQVNMASVVDSQSRLVDTLASSHHPGLEKVATKNAADVSLTEILRGMNSAWIESQNAFTASTSRTLTSTSESLARRQPALTDYFTLQQEIARINAANGSAAVSAQATSDKEHYDGLFSAYLDELRNGDGSWTGLRGFDSVDADGHHSGVLPTMQETVARYDGLAQQYNARVRELVDSLTDQRGELDKSITKLQELEEKLIEQYFTVPMSVNDDTYDVDVTTFGDDLARKALALKLAKTFDSGDVSPTVPMYEKRLHGLVSKISTDPVRFAELVAAVQQASPGFDPTSYTDDLRLIKRYADAANIVTSTLNVLQPSAQVDQTVTTSLSVTVGPGERQTVDIALPSTLAATDVTVTAAPPTSTCSGCVDVDPAANTVTIDNTTGESALTVPLTYGIHLRGVPGMVNIDYSSQATTGGESTPPQIIRSDVYALVPADPRAAGLATDFGDIATYLSDIRTAANLLHMLFGTPDESLESFAARAESTGDFRNHSAESVYHRYGVIDGKTIESHLHQDDVKAYGKLGHATISSIVEQIRAAINYREQIADEIYTLSALDLSSSFFSDALSGLEAWYSAAVVAVNAAPERWQEKPNAVIQLSTVPWSGQEEGKAELYLDERTGPMLYESLSQLVTATSAEAAGVAEGARAISDNSEQFDVLLAGIQRTQSDAHALLDAMSGSITTGSTDQTTASEFSKRFATVLSNTRANGADPAKIYESFATPVTTRDTTASAAAAVGAGFDYRWLAIFAAGSLIGSLGAWLVLRRARRANR